MHDFTASWFDTQKKQFSTSFAKIFIETMSSTCLITEQRSQDELHAPPKLVHRRIVDPGKPVVTRLKGEGLVALAKRLNDQDFIEPPDADSTKKNLESIMEKWSRYVSVYSYKHFIILLTQDHDNVELM